MSYKDKNFRLNNIPQRGQLRHQFAGQKLTSTSSRPVPLFIGTRPPVGAKRYFSDLWSDKPEEITTNKQIKVDEGGLKITQTISES